MPVASKSHVKRITAALAALDLADGPVSRLEAARQLREAAEELEAAQIAAARKAGVTWIEIGACYGLTKQGAQQRFQSARNQKRNERLTFDLLGHCPLCFADLRGDFVVRLVHIARDLTSPFLKNERRKAEGDEGQLMGGGDSLEEYKRMKQNEQRKKSEREIRREEMERAKREEVEEKRRAWREREEGTVSMLRELARQRFG